MQEYFLRCVLRVLLLIPLITVAGVQVDYLIDGPVVLGTPPLSGRMPCAGR
jgi:hypothetical protein